MNIFEENEIAFMTISFIAQSLHKPENDELSYLTALFRIINIPY